MKRFSSKVRKISVIAVAVMMLVGLMPTTVLAAACEDGKHTPGTFVVKQNYTECGGGYKADAYICSICNDFTSRCDINGNTLVSEAGTGNHAYVTKAEDYTDCCGGYKVEHSVCTVCGTDSVGTYEEAVGVSGIGAQGTNTLTQKCQLVQAKAATAEEDGNIEYWKCKTCGQAIVQGATIQKVSASEVIIPKLGGSTTPSTPVVTPQEYAAAVTAPVETESGVNVTKQEAVSDVTVVAKAETVIEAVNTQNEAAGVNEKQEIKAVIDITVDVTPTKENPVKLTFSVPSIKAGANVVVLHYDAATGTWESDSVSDVVVSEGKVSAKFSALSPIAIVEKVPTKSAGDLAWEQYWTNWIWNNMQAGNNTETSATAPTSPKTFDITGGLFALVSLAGVGTVVCGKKAKNN